VWKESRSEASTKFQNCPFWGAKRTNKNFRIIIIIIKRKEKKIKPPLSPPFSAFNIVEIFLTR
jgi:hypothetical protein